MRTSAIVHNAPSVISWPDAVAYREAIQSPALCVGDPLLAGASLRLDKLGLPLTHTGRFAAVFSLIATDGERYALRCFTSPDVPGDIPRAARYRLLADHAAELGNLFVPFRFVPHGIRVGGNWHPAVVLRWAEGTALGNWVEMNRKNGARLRRLANTLSATLARLEDAGIAHGDWQHDNLLVSETGDLVTLVDYDGMFVPELAGYPAPELGHPNYQHPLRTREHFGVGLDRFSCLCLRCALLALAADPTLWERYGGGESLLFTASDFRDPGSSALFAELRTLVERVRDEALADAVARLLDACRATDPTDALLPTVSETTPAPRNWDELLAPPVEVSAPTAATAGARAPKPDAKTMSAMTKSAAPAIITSSKWWAQTETVIQIATRQEFKFLAQLNRPTFQKIERAILIGGVVMPLMAMACVVGYCITDVERWFGSWLWWCVCILGYVCWPTRIISRRLESDIVTLRTRRDALMAQLAAAQRGQTQSPTASVSRDAYVESSLRQLTLGLGSGIVGVRTTHLRALADAGIVDAYQLSQRRDPPPDISPGVWTVLKQWADERRTEALSTWRVQNSPGSVSAALTTELAEVVKTMDRLGAERKLFPSTGVLDYARAIGEAFGWRGRRP